ncbi:hypothetical protein [Cellulomonas biazotea]|uniref:Bacterial HORMA domain-containing protein n=1 Tax=Cellulomonas biazotea TaxID=1709 RepID=A0A402DPF6_9CELL|nr:hypothetical protein [Cellulomonas biazotea]GCE75994.1 hypothetical protein CBZ_10500 [Cellulomonas biazotea]
MTYTSAHTTTYTRTHTATHLADVVMSSIAEILATLGIDSTSLYRDWQQDASAISAWIEEGSLAVVVLECTRPSGVTDPIFEFAVTYTAGGYGDKKFTADNASLMRYAAKLKAVPSGTTFRLFCTFSGSHSSQPGWSAGTRASTDGLRTRTIGTLAGGPHGTATTRLLTS